MYLQLTAIRLPDEVWCKSTHPTVDVWPVSVLTSWPDGFLIMNFEHTMKGYILFGHCASKSSKPWKSTTFSNKCFVAYNNLKLIILNHQFMFVSLICTRKLLSIVDDLAFMNTILFIAISKYEQDWQKGKQIVVHY